MRKEEETSLHFFFRGSFWSGVCSWENRFSFVSDWNHQREKEFADESISLRVEKERVWTERRESTEE